MRRRRPTLCAEVTFLARRRTLGWSVCAAVMGSIMSEAESTCCQGYLAMPRRNLRCSTVHVSDCAQSAGRKGTWSASAHPPILAICSKIAQTWSRHSQEAGLCYAAAACDPRICIASTLIVPFVLPRSYQHCSVHSGSISRTPAPSPLI